MERLVRDALKKPEYPVGKEEEFGTPKIIVVGVGGAGCNSVRRMAEMGIKGATLYAINTDKQHLDTLPDDITKVLIGKSVTRGLGAGGYPEVGRKAAEISKAEIEKIVEGAHLVFLVAGMGGGTGTGASPVVAEIAKEQGAIVVAMVTYPFRLERARMKKADEGIQELAKVADTVIVIDNNRLVELVPNLPMEEAFKVADTVIAKAVQGITETITQPSLINLDYADVKAIMGTGGLSVIAVGEGKGQDKVYQAVEDTLHNALLDVDIAGAKGVLIHITGGPSLTLAEATLIGELLTQEVSPDATVIWGARIDPTFKDEVLVIAIFTGVTSPYIRGTPARALSYEESTTAYDLEYI